LPERRWTGGRHPPQDWGVYEEIEQEGSGVAASDHAAIFVDINL
jgi:hypothetical protein